jgi:DNA-binding FadR family transcriptional regulator
MAQPVIRTSVPDQVFDRLREAILAGRYVPGEQLPSQRALAGDLGVNLASVREALGRLEQLRLIEVRHGEPMRVRDWRRAGGLEALVLVAAAEEDVVRPLFEARRLLLAESARLAARRRSEEQAAAIEEGVRAVAAAPGDGAALLADWTFMAAIVQAAGNLVFQLIMNSVRELYLPHAEAFAPVVARREQLAPHYDAVAAAVRAQDGADAAEAIGRLAAAQEARMLEGS